MEPPLATILVVDDHPPTRELLRSLFGYQGHDVLLASDGPSGLEAAAANPLALIVTDVVMPGMDGFTFVRELRRRTPCLDTPVIMMSAALNDAEARTLAADCGALSFLVKPFEPQTALAVAEAALARARAASASGPANPDISARHRALFANALTEKVHELEVLNHDLEAKVAERTRELASVNARLRDQANRDPLTGLFNRRYLDDTLPRELARCRREALPLPVALIDLDHFKRVNDTHGHEAGDATLRHLAAGLRQSLRGADLACRYGGEEFVVALPGASGETALARLEALRERIAASAVAEVRHAEIRVSFSAGLAVFPRDGQEAHALLRAADEAMYRAKQAGRNRVALASAPQG